VGSVEECSLDEVRDVFETNVFGTLRLVQALLPRMRAQGSGRIASVTSKGAFQGQPACSIYCASKSALMGIFEGLVDELAPFGIDVTMIEPGLIVSDFHSRGIMRAAKRMPEYEDTCGYLRIAVESPQGDDAADTRLAALAIYEGMTAPTAPRHLPLGADALEMIRTKLAFVNDELDTWEHVALGVKPVPVGGGA
jgi:NAD(P)-dependent dehydrogenase (short-subunit alcohol dehydrogenase family)